MGAGYLLKNLFALTKSMRSLNLNYQVINNIKFNNQIGLSILFKFDIVDSTKDYTLGLFKRRSNEYMALPLIYEVNKNGEYFKLPMYLDELTYKKLYDFLEIQKSGNSKFQPQFLYDVLNNSIPTKANLDRLDRKVCSYSYTKDNALEKEKIYFDHFLDNDKRGFKRSPENIDKTEMFLTGVNKLIGNRNISVCFTSIYKSESDEKTSAREKIKHLK